MVVLESPLRSLGCRKLKLQLSPLDASLVTATNQNCIWEPGRRGGKLVLLNTKMRRQICRSYRDDMSRREANVKRKYAQTRVYTTVDMRADDCADERRK